MKPKHTAELYQSRRTKQWHWRITHANGNITADSGEGYARRIDCVRSLRNMLTTASATCLYLQAVELGKAR